MVNPNYLSILHHFIEPYKQDSNVIGIFLVWSYAYGNPHKNSDLDVYIITQTGHTRTKWTTIKDWLEIEYFINPLSQVQKYLSEWWDKISTAHMLAHGIVLYDNSTEIQKLIDLAQQIRNSPLPNISEIDKELMKYEIDDLMKNLEDSLIVENSINFHITQAYLINKLIQILFQLKQQYLAKKSAPYQEIIAIDKEFWRLLNDIYLQDSLTKKYQSTKKLAEYIEQQLWWPKPSERSITWPCIYN